jgi:hypothetical protein
MPSYASPLFVVAPPRFPRQVAMTPTTIVRTAIISCACLLTGFASREISFHAEYRVRLQYGQTHSEATQTTFRAIDDQRQVRTSERDIDFWDFDSVDVLMGLSIYF